MIAEGEHQQQDFKYCINDSRKIARSMVAFANTDGGRLLLGIKDNGSVAGVRSDEEYYMAEAAAKLYSKPPVNFQTHQWLIEGKTVLEINIQKSGEIPHSAQNEEGKWRVYIRKNDQNIVAPGILLKIWEQQKSPHGVHIRFQTKKNGCSPCLSRINISPSINSHVRQNFRDGKGRGFLSSLS